MSTVEKALKKYIEYPESDGEPMGETDKHRDLTMELILTLRFFFQRKKNVYVSGDLMMYYEEGEPSKMISPDVFVVFGVPKGERRVYKFWDEGRAPDVAVEISSRKTWKEDYEKKLKLYAELGIKEYFIFDPEYPRRRRAFSAYRLSGNRYIELLITNGRVKSNVLGLELVDTGETLRLYNPRTKKFLPTEAERVEALLQSEKALQESKAELQRLESERQAEAEARQKAERELAQLRAELERLRTRK